jgi:AcrR family transcriptional regulator
MNDHDPRVKRTRKLLREALYTLLRDKSFDAITVQDIAMRATVNRATFYAHYQDKYTLMDDIIREEFRQALEQTVPPTAPLTAGSLRTLCQTVLSYMAQVQDHCKPSAHLYNPQFDKAVQEVLSTFLDDWLSRFPRGDVRGASRSTTSTVISWAIFGTGAQWSRGPRTQTAEALAKQVVALLANIVAESPTSQGSDLLGQAAHVKPDTHDSPAAR